MKAFGVVARLKAPIGYTGVWVNFYLIGNRRIHSGGAYATRAEADRIAKSYRHDCAYTLVKKVTIK